VLVVALRPIIACVINLKLVVIVPAAAERVEGDSRCEAAE